MGEVPLQPYMYPSGSEHAHAKSRIVRTTPGSRVRTSERAPKRWCRPMANALRWSLRAASARRSEVTPSADARPHAVLPKMLLIEGSMLELAVQRTWNK
jgi:hypothetical protein